jgi:hypothetical protein
VRELEKVNRGVGKECNLEDQEKTRKLRRRYQSQDTGADARIQKWEANSRLEVRFYPGEKNSLRLPSGGVAIVVS